MIKNALRTAWPEEPHKIEMADFPADGKKLPDVGMPSALINGLCPLQGGKKSDT